MAFSILLCLPVYFQRATHPLHNNDGFCLHLPVFLLPEEPSEEHHDCEMVKMTKSKTFQAYLPNCHRTYSCIHCRAHLANHDELISK
ncbi:hypothetical protein M9458_012281, partial [Cirrhinus mrigala]